MLGVPTVADRIAQTVVARRLEAKAEPIFHPDSYGYRPGRSTRDAVAACRKRCWKIDWVIDLDIQKFFDSVPWDLVVKAVEAHTDDRWVVLYVQWWLQAPVQLPNGTLQKRDCGTPQGSAVSPVLANLFLHYAFDAWMAREYPTVAFERYVDDTVVHCVSDVQAHQLVAAIAQRMEQIGLRLHPDKTKIVYCQDGTRRGSYEHTAFTFLGCTFRQRRARNKHGRNFNNFLPAISKEALKKNQCGGALMATAPPYRRHSQRPCPAHQSDRGGMDALLRGVLPLRVVSALVAHQRLLDGLDPQEIHTAAKHQESPRALAGNHRNVFPDVHILEMDRLGPACLTTRMTRAV